MRSQALVDLVVQVLPVWVRQLAGARSQSEVAVADMLAAFAEIGPHLDMASRQSKQITAALAQGDGGMTQLAQACDQVLQPALLGCTPQATQAIVQVMGMIHTCVDALAQIAQPFEHETQMVGQQVERMYKGFQYQDRISQMMTLLQDDMERLQCTLNAPQQPVDATAWLARLQAQYVMTEQREQHLGAGHPETHKPDDEETTFF